MGIPRVCYHRTVWDHKLVHIPRVIKEVTLPAISSSFIQRVSTGVRFRAIRLDSLTCSSKSQERPSRTRSSSAYFARRISKHRGRCLKGWFWKLADTKSMLSDNLIRKLQQANVIGVLGFEDKETRYTKSEVGNRKNKEKENIEMKYVSRWRRPKNRAQNPRIWITSAVPQGDTRWGFQRTFARAQCRLSHPRPADDSSEGLNLLYRTTGIVVWYPKRSRDWMNSGRESNLGSMVVAVGKHFSPSPVFERFWYLM